MMLRTIVLQSRKKKQDYPLGISFKLYRIVLLKTIHLISEGLLLTINKLDIREKTIRKKRDAAICLVIFQFILVDKEKQIS